MRLGTTEGYQSMFVMQIFGRKLRNAKRVMKNEYA